METYIFQGDACQVFYHQFFRWMTANNKGRGWNHAGLVDWFNELHGPETTISLETDVYGKAIFILTTPHVVTFKLMHLIDPGPE